MDWAELNVKKETRSPKVRKVYQIRSMAGQIIYRVHNSSLVNLYRGIVERIFAVENDEGQLVPPPRPKADIWQCMVGFRNKLRRFAVFTQPYEPEEFVATYRGAKLRIYTLAMESLLRTPLQLKDAYTRPFVKADKFCKPDPAPRIITCRSPRYNLSLGVYIKKVEKLVYRAINKVFGSTVVFKGMNGPTMARKMRKKWDKFVEPVAVGLDASRFDQHISEQALRWEHSCYPMFFQKGLHKELEYLLSLQIKNIGFAAATDGTIHYKVRGTRASGDMNTSVGNTLIMCGLVHTFLEQHAIKAEFINNGDDCVLILEKRHLHKLEVLPKWFLDYGFNMVVEPPVYTFEHIVFCQSQPVWNGVEWVMVRQHKVVLSKDCCTLINISDPVLHSRWRNQVSEAGQCLTSGVPVQSRFYRRLGHGSIHGVLPNQSHYLTGLLALANGLVNKRLPITPEARVSYWLAFGVTPEEQEAIEQNIDDLDPSYQVPLVGDWSQPITHYTSYLQTS